MNIVILGPQGSGKGTQASKLSEKFGFSYLDAGALLRELAKTNSQIDAMINQKGVLIPDTQMFEIIKNYLNENKRYDDLFLDGYPRSIEQFELIQSFFAEHGTKIEKVFFLSIPKEETIRRLSARRIQKSTGKIYNLLTNPPDSEVSEDDLEQRPDDLPEAIEERLHAYHQSTEPLVNFLREKNLLFEVDGTASIDEIFAILSQEIERIKK